MFAKLTGKIDNIFSDAIILDINDVGYKIFISKKNLHKIENLDEKKHSFFIETIVREDYIHLYGFSSLEEQEFFNILCKINGISSKIAIKILGSTEIIDIINAVNIEDKAIFTNISGIGPKLASRILIELKDPIKKLNFDNIDYQESDNSNITNNQLIADTISALENLGYKRNTIQKIAKNQVNNNPDITLETLITQCLREL